MADGSVGKSIRYGNIESWRFKHKVSFGKNGKKRLPNGMDGHGFVETYKLHCADFRVSMSDYQGLSGTSRDKVCIIAVRHKPNRHYDDLLAQYKGETFDVEMVMPDESRLRGVDLIVLRKKVKNG